MATVVLENIFPSILQLRDAEKDLVANWSSSKPLTVQKNGHFRRQSFPKIFRNKWLEKHKHLQSSFHHQDNV
jgi:hypothetical protein